jgi:hypothetical protein
MQLLWSAATVTAAAATAAKELENLGAKRTTAFFASTFPTL